MSAGAAGAGAAVATAQIAKGALRRLALAKLEPTPENYARAWAEECGQPPPAAAPAGAAAAPAATATALDAKTLGPQWAQLVERIARGLERGGRQWTAARKKDSLQRVLDGSRGDLLRLQQRLGALASAWEGERPLPGGDDPGPPDDAVQGAAGLPPVAQDAADDPASIAGTGPVAGADSEAGAGRGTEPGRGPVAGAHEDCATVPAADTRAGPAEAGDAWQPVLAEWRSTLRAALPAAEPRAGELADRLARLGDALAAEGPLASHVAEAAAVCEAARRWFGRRNRLVEELAALCRELGAGLAELAEDDSWTRGQCEALALQLGAAMAPSAGANAEPGPASTREAVGPAAGGQAPALPELRGLRTAGALLAETRARQAQVRRERDAARDALKGLIRSLLAELGTLGEQTGRFSERVGRHADAIERADSLQGLAGVVRELVQESRAVQQQVGLTQARLAAEHAKAGELEARVRALEAELRRLSDEVSTDALTQVANRRGLAQAFEAETARALRAAAEPAQEDAASGGAQEVPGLAIGLIDIDNFKRLNDTLGHAAGDVALKSLAAAVRERLRPADHLARFGGEEFVVLLPETALGEARQALTRLQRGLSEALFLHEGREVFVTFSAGVTRWRPGEALEAALERADEALYEAKRTGKNRTCVA